jgi:hypothetical protein
MYGVLACRGNRIFMGTLQGRRTDQFALPPAIYAATIKILLGSIVRRSHII